uniref:Uncharacterized protein n=1 Tax=Ditylenchus dipsaci TaxID=166011 RepID=A0A915CN19_9BILA
MSLRFTLALSRKVDLMRGDTPEIGKGTRSLEETGLDGLKFMDSKTSTRFSQEKAARLAELVKDNLGNLLPGKKAFKNAAQTVERKYQKYEKYQKLKKRNSI